MELEKIGKFLAELRKENGFTQEQLGEKIGVTNKTVSRWETGTYLPPAEALTALSDLYHISINEILSGRRMPEDTYKEAAEKNLAQAISASSFTLKERIDYYKKKWLKDHIAVMVFLGICIFAILTTGIILKDALLSAAAMIFYVAAHIWRYNTMMTYVEARAFDGKGM